MRLEIGAPHGCVYRHAVADDMEIGLPEVDDPVAGPVLDPRIADVPLTRHGPIEDVGARGHFAHLQGNLASDDGQRVANAPTRDAATDRVHLPNEVVHRPTGRFGVSQFPGIVDPVVQALQTFHGSEMDSRARTGLYSLIVRKRRHGIAEIQQVRSTQWPKRRVNDPCRTSTKPRWLRAARRVEPYGCTSKRLTPTGRSEVASGRLTRSKSVFTASRRSCRQPTSCRPSTCGRSVETSKTSSRQWARASTLQEWRRTSSRRRRPTVTAKGSPTPRGERQACRRRC